MTNKYTKIEQIIRPAVESFNCRIYGLELIQGGRRHVLRVLLEGLEHSITIGEISTISRQISRVLDVADIMSDGYVLEVSSPGLDRPLFEYTHFKAAIGEKVTVSLNPPQDQRKKFIGKLINVDEDTLELMEEDSSIYYLPIVDVVKARVIPEIKIGKGQKS